MNAMELVTTAMVHLEQWANHQKTYYNLFIWTDIFVNLEQQRVIIFVVDNEKYKWSKDKGIQSLIRQKFDEITTAMNFKINLEFAPNN